MNLWNIKAYIYSLRTSPLFAWVLNAEKNNLRELVWKVDNIQGMILDIGTGTGHTLDILPDSKQIICLDRSVGMLNKINQKKQQNLKLTADAFYLPFKNNTFSFVSCVGVSEYLRNLIFLYLEVNRILKNDGYFLTTISPPNLWNGVRRISGNRLHTVSAKFAQDTANNTGFEKIGELHSLMQYQYLFKK